MTEADFTDWLRKALPGEKFIYAEAPCLALAGGTAQHIAGVALRAFYASKVELVQKRISGPPDGYFPYLAIKRRNVEPRFRPHWKKLPRVKELAA